MTMLLEEHAYLIPSSCISIAKSTYIQYFLVLEKKCLSCLQSGANILYLLRRVVLRFVNYFEKAVQHPANPIVQKKTAQQKSSGSP
jgi:hypothetical protein